ncbi:hypothetical protein [Paenibacillus terrigena]|uniref:hypothetical protein n=1 Tax=Paenibacillus terrigena TaxID=369333 RepID=UPI00035CC30C|nr:hypothetical protein [Paenibacillus terrigena]
MYPTKTRIVGLCSGEEVHDFLRMHHRKIKAETSKARVYYTTQKWLTAKAEARIREVVKERLAPPSMRKHAFQEQVRWMGSFQEVKRLAKLHGLKKLL